jgi:hypothetical protein
MAGLDPAIHDFLAVTRTWMPWPSTAKTRFALLPGHDELKDIAAPIAASFRVPVLHSSLIYHPALW